MATVRNYALVHLTQLDFLTAVAAFLLAGLMVLCIFGIIGYVVDKK